MTMKKAGVLLVVIVALALAGCGSSSSDSGSTAASAQNGRCLGVEEVRIAVDKVVFGPNAESEPEDEQQEKVEAIEERGCQAQK